MPLPFLTKKAPEGKGILPVERVRELASKGFSEIDIIDILRREGYSPEEIDKALTQATKAEVTAARPTQPAAETEPKLPTLEEIAPPEPRGMPEVPETSLPEEYYQQTYPVEEYIDYIVQTRMQELNEKFIEFSTKTNELEKRIENLNERIEEFVRMRNVEQTQLLSRIDAFKDTVVEVDTRIGGLEKAFKETLPALIESVRALSDLVQRLKREA